MEQYSGADKTGPWRSKETGWACPNSSTGHQIKGADVLRGPVEGELTEEERLHVIELYMLGKAICVLCRQELTFAPREGTLSEAEAEAYLEEVERQMLGLPAPSNPDAVKWKKGEEGAQLRPERRPIHPRVKR